MSIRRLSHSLTALAVAGLLAACANTVRGVGKDVKGTVSAIEDTVN